jgi:hypothetical protein
MVDGKCHDDDDNDGETKVFQQTATQNIEIRSK